MNVDQYPPYFYNNLINETKTFEIKPTFVITTKSQHLRLPDGKLKFISSQTFVPAHEEYAANAEAIVQKMLQIPQRMKHCVYNKFAMLNILVPTQEGGNKEEKNKALQEVNGFMSKSCGSLSKEKISTTSEQEALFEDLSNAVMHAGLNSDTYELVRTPITSTLDIPTHINSQFLIAASKPLNVSQVVDNIVKFFSDKDFRKIINNPNNKFLLNSIRNNLIENQSRANISSDIHSQIQNKIKYLNFVERAKSFPSSRSFLYNNQHYVLTTIFTLLAIGIVGLRYYSSKNLTQKIARSKNPVVIKKNKTRSVKPEVSNSTPRIRVSPEIHASSSEQQSYTAESVCVPQTATSTEKTTANKNLPDYISLYDSNNFHILLDQNIAESSENKDLLDQLKDYLNVYLSTMPVNTDLKSILEKKDLENDKKECMGLNIGGRGERRTVKFIPNQDSVAKNISISGKFFQEKIGKKIKNIIQFKTISGSAN